MIGCIGGTDPYYHTYTYNNNNHNSSSNNTNGYLDCLCVYCQAAIGITDLSRPDYGEAVSVHTGEVAVFWACGVTPQAVVSRCR